ncbi:hypothetical protein [Rouxiella badensis]|uniref:hypothetical protein n=1 Tax=Rouxiella badensis TaxID=1646377 RepID=UPI0022AA2B8C|nr:hypothetical protein [Rouxiella badensis]WAT10152.1 hypothetical protein O1V65_06200 [Rouxiella badensis]
MARKQKTVSLNKGRDKGKRFIITEMSAAQIDRWSLRLLNGVYGSGKGAELSQIGSAAAMAQILFAAAGKGNEENTSVDKDNASKAVEAMFMDMLIKADPAVSEVLQAELMAQVQIMPSPSDPTVTRALEEDDIEELSSISKIRAEAIKINIDFFTDAAE